MFFLLPFFLSVLLALAITPLIISLYKKMNWIDDPKKNKHAKVLHERPVPRGGGLVIALAVLITGLVTLSFSATLTAIFIGMIVLAVIGMVDDIYDVSPYFRLIGGFAVASFVVLAGVGIDFVTNPFGEGVVYLNQLSQTFLLLGYPIHISFIADTLAVVWIVWNMNIVNWSKGLDGQLPGVVAIAAIFIGILGLRFQSDPQQISLIILSFIVAGAYLGFLFWNVYPQWIMPGYGAGSLGGYFLAILSIFSGAKLATALLVLGIPTADALFTIMRRLRSKKSPFWGDRGHLHHKLYDVLGWSKPKIAAFYWLTTFLLGLLALQLKPDQKLFTIVVLIALIFGFLIWVKLFFTSSSQPDRDNG